MKIVSILGLITLIPLSAMANKKLLESSMNWEFEKAKSIVLNDASVNINYTNSSENNSLVYSLRKNNTDFAMLLIDHGSSLSIQNRQGQTALMLSAEWRNEEVLKYLLTKNINTNVLDHSGNNALIYAAKNSADTSQLVQELLCAGSDIDQQNIDGNSALFEAVYYGNLKNVTLLAKEGASLNLKNKSQLTPLQYAIKEYKTDAAKSLIAFGANMNLKGGVDNESALMLATDNPQVSVVDALISRGADLNSKNRQGYTALHLAVLKIDDYSRYSDVGDKAMIIATRLIKAGAKLKLTNNSGDSAYSTLRSEAYGLGKVANSFRKLLKLSKLYFN
jgi:ankyrin repeat protein